MRYPVAAGRYDGRRALITGGATGLGFATAARLASEGAAIGLVDRDGTAVQAAVERLRINGCDVTAYTADVTDPASIQEVVRQFRERGGSIDLLVTMAGV